METTAFQLIILICCAILIGFSKTGVPTLGILVAAILASVFPVMDSVGLLLPILITGDLIAIIYYRKTVIWRLIMILLPWVVVGIVVGFLVLGQINNSALSVLIGTLVLALIVIFLLQQRIERLFRFSMAQSKVVTGSLGILAGFTTMVGNAAGSIMSIYLMSQGIDKKTFIGTNAYFFFILNVLKVPLLIWLQLINPQSIMLNVWMIPAVMFGAWLGIRLLPRIPQQHFQRIVLFFAAVGGIYLMLG